MAEDAPWRRNFDNARDPYTARNALGILSLGGGGSGFITAVTPPLQVTGTTLSIDLSGYQPIDGDLTAISGLTGTNVIYYRSAANTWTAVTIGANLTFAGGVLAASGGGSGTPGGSTTQVQFNDAGAFGGDADLIWNKTTNLLTVNGNISVTGGVGNSIQTNSAIQASLFRCPGTVAVFGSELTAGVVNLRPNGVANTTGQFQVQSSGVVTATGPTRLALGTEAAPAYSFTSNTGSGMFANANDLIFSVGGNTKLTLTPSTGAFISGPMAVSGTLTASSSIRNADGTTGAPSYTFTNATGTGFWLVAANSVGLSGALTASGALNAGGDITATRDSTTTRIQARRITTGAADISMLATSSLGMIGTDNSVPLALYTNGTGNERGRITTGGSLQWGNTVDNPGEGGSAGVALVSSGVLSVGSASNPPVRIGYNTSGTNINLINFYTGGTLQGGVACSSAGVVSISAFLGVHWSRLETAQELLSGTVMDIVDDLVAWPNETNDRLPMVKVSDTPGSRAVYGTFLNVDESDDHGDINVASVGAGYVRMQPGAVVTIGDLVESAGDGCARRQADDVIRSCTIGKIICTTASETHADGSFVLPCVLYCG